MSKYEIKIIRFISLMGFLFVISQLVYPQTNFSLKKILEKNIQVAGGKERLTAIKNYSFRIGFASYYLSSDGIMKITQGREPALWSVVIVNKDNVKMNFLNSMTEVTGRDKLIYQFLARLRSGFFTLMNFRNQLEFQGLKRFGPQTFFQVSHIKKNQKIDFFLDSEKCMLKRLVFHHVNPEQGKYEVSYDFGPLQEVDGLMLPSSWFRTEIAVGSRGHLYEPTDIKINEPLEKGFFSTFEVNMGKVTINKNSLQGNVLDFFPWQRQDCFIILTNWTDKSIRKAGFKTNDRLILTLDDTDYKIVFYQSNNEAENANAYIPGAKIMSFNPDLGSLYWIVFWQHSTEEINKVKAKSSLLLPIQVKKK